MLAYERKRNIPLCCKSYGLYSNEIFRTCWIAKEDIDYLIPHQANIRIIESAAKRLHLPMDKVFVNIEKYGNASAASIPIAMAEAYQSGKLKKAKS